MSLSLAESVAGLLDRFPDPNRLDLSRVSNRHAVFGCGRHFEFTELKVGFNAT